ncbi:hypothetical protein Q1695_010873 [Nippostrongylus brasiliensis]|nr:hypothetical protein Q1695_010873 [Nippostrongylus brasiliensis]
MSVRTPRRISDDYGDNLPLDADHQSVARPLRGRRRRRGRRADEIQCAICRSVQNDDIFSTTLITAANGLTRVNGIGRRSVEWRRRPSSRYHSLNWVSFDLWEYDDVQTIDDGWRTTVDRGKHLAGDGNLFIWRELPHVCRMIESSSSLDWVRRLPSATAFIVKLGHDDVLRRAGCATTTQPAGCLRCRTCWVLTSGKGHPAGW